MAYASITKPSLHFNTKLYTGNGSAGNAQTGVGFQPDFLWIKNRTASQEHWLADAVRGTTKFIESNSTNAESSDGATGLASFDSDGFTVNGSARTNQNSASMVAWNWKAGTTSGITQGSATITPSSYSINATAGFSIIKWVGTNAHASLPHGLGVAPKMIIIRRLDSTSDWVVYHHSVGNTKRLVLNSTAAESGASGGWFNNLSPTANLFNVGTDGGSNGSTDNYIAYCFAEKKGYSKAGGYNGNGNADGVFQYCGFKPSFLLLKRSGNTANWLMFDNKREGYNVDNDELYANTTDTEQTYDHVDFLSNGFKLRANSSSINANASGYVWFAFAEEPLVANVGASIPATAR